MREQAKMSSKKQLTQHVVFGMRGSGSLGYETVVSYGPAISRHSFREVYRIRSSVLNRPVRVQPKDAPSGEASKD